MPTLAEIEVIEWLGSNGPRVSRIDGRQTWRTCEGISHHSQFLMLSWIPPLTPGPLGPVDLVPPEAGRVGCWARIQARLRR